MASKLVALGFAGEFTAEEMLDTLKDLVARGALELEDAVIISRPAFSDQLIMKPTGTMVEPPASVPGSETTVRQTTNPRGRVAAKGAGIGLLAGWLLGGPVGGAAVGALIGALRDRGIDDKFVAAIANQVYSDSSALLLLVQRADLGVVLQAISPFKGEVIETDLSPETEKSLREALARQG